MKRLLIITILFGSCGRPTTAPENITYFKDERAGLCFARMISGSAVTHSITCVPCDSVQNLIIK